MPLANVFARVVASSLFSIAPSSSSSLSAETLKAMAASNAKYLDENYLLDIVYSRPASSLRVLSLMSPSNVNNEAETVAAPSADDDGN